MDVNAFPAVNQSCSIKGSSELEVEIRGVKLQWTILVMDIVGYSCIRGLDMLQFTSPKVRLLFLKY